MKRQMTRRSFLTRTAAGAAGGGFVILGDSPSARAYVANEKLNVALIGVGGRGSWFVETIPRIGENVVAMCDVNEQRAADSFAKLPDVAKYRDFRKLLDEKDREIDAVVVATPDHTHAVISAAAIRHGKHVYCEKPLTHDVAEARALRELARKHGVATQMGNQGTATGDFRRGVELVWAGAGQDPGGPRLEHWWKWSAASTARRTTRSSDTGLGPMARTGCLAPFPFPVDALAHLARFCHRKVGELGPTQCEPTVHGTTR